MGGGSKSLGLSLFVNDLDVVVDGLTPGMPAAECQRIALGDYLRTVDGHEVAVAVHMMYTYTQTCIHLTPLGIRWTDRMSEA